jgi:hypothetical protein
MHALARALDRHHQQRRRRCTCTHAHHAYGNQRIARARRAASCCAAFGARSIRSASAGCMHGYCPRAPIRSPASPNNCRRARGSQLGRSKCGTNRARSTSWQEIDCMHADRSRVTMHSCVAALRPGPARGTDDGRSSDPDRSRAPLHMQVARCCRARRWIDQCTLLP